jgi:hypothetical protein
LCRDPIEEEGGINPYGFLGNNALNSFDILGQYGWGVVPPPGYPPTFPPPTKPDLDPVGFAICQRDFQNDRTLISAVMYGALNMLGGSHAYVHYKECSDCSTVGWGFSGGDARPNPDDEKAFNPNDCKPCERTGTLLKYGIAKDKKTGKQASDAEIVDCIRNAPIRKSYSPTILNRYVCWDWAKEAAKDCGLNCK